MSKYLFQVNYVGDLAKGLLQEGGSRRREEATKAVESLGGTVECLYYAFGGTDAYLIVDLPDHASAAHVSLLVKSSGFDCTTTVLLTPEEIDEATELSPNYRPPGQ